MLRFGIPTLIETATIEECAALCAEAGLSFIEMNMNLPQYQVETMDEKHLKQVAHNYGIDYTIHLDENLAPADFSPQVAAAYRQVAVDTVEFAKKMEIPTLNMHLIQGVYFTLPHVKVYLYDKFRDYYRDNMLRFRDDVTRAAEGSGVRLCIENWHGYTDYQIPVLDELLESPAFGPPTKDHQALGTGELDIFKCLNLAKEQDISVVVETKTIAGLKQSAAWLHDNWK